MVGVVALHAGPRQFGPASTGPARARVLGVDPGLTRCGLGVVEGLPGRPPALIAAGLVRTGADEDVADRLLAIEEEIERWLTEYRPDTVAVERVFSQHNVRTVMGTAQAGAVAIVCAARRGLPVALHTPSEVKAAVTGNGRADKDQVTAMVMRLLRMTERPRPADTADALALAICHLWRAPAIRVRQPTTATAGPVLNDTVLDDTVLKDRALKDTVLTDTGPEQTNMRRVSGGET